MTEENFDDFINWNKEVFIAFHDNKYDAKTLRLFTLRYIGHR